ncbi:MAG: hypothetical protein GX776_08605 [Oxalobacter sp.]|nr:hypothetical protein [Oxalobacter sp.]
MNALVFENYRFRMTLLGATGKNDIYEKAARQKLKQFDVLWYQQDRDIPEICKTAKALIRIADDVLAGGTGDGEELAHPWNNCTPDEMFSLMRQYRRLCISKNPARACRIEEVRQLDKESNALYQAFRESGYPGFPAYVDRQCEIRRKILSHFP